MNDFNSARLKWYFHQEISWFIAEDTLESVDCTKIVDMFYDVRTNKMYLDKWIFYALPPSPIGRWRCIVLHCKTGINEAGQLGWGYACCLENIDCVHHQHDEIQPCKSRYPKIHFNIDWTSIHTHTLTRTESLCASKCIMFCCSLTQNVF